MNFKFDVISIERVIVHRMLPRTHDKQPAAPGFSEALMMLDVQGETALETRISTALASKSHGIEMSIVENESGSFFQYAASMIPADDSIFIERSKLMAKQLAKAMAAAPTAPPGMLAIVQGRVGENDLRFLAAIKAESHDGFATKSNSGVGQFGVDYIRDIFLTQSQRFFKIGVLVELSASPPDPEGFFAPAKYRAFLFDHLMTSLTTKPAAAYFYRVFLGMATQENAKQLTAKFYDQTRNFINTASLDQEVKRDLLDALRVELKSQNATLSTAGFAEQYFPPEIQKQYADFMKKGGFPENTVEKDVEFVKSKLRRPRKVTFINGVQVTGPADTFSDTVEFYPDANGEETTVIIHSGIKVQE